MHAVEVVRAGSEAWQPQSRLSPDPGIGPPSLTEDAMNDEDMQSLLAEAAAAYAADIERLADLDEDQLYYLAHLDEVADPLTDGREATVDEDLAAAIESFTRWEIDGRQIVVHLVPDQSGPPVEVWTAQLEKPTSGGALPLEVMAALKLALESEGSPPPYQLDAKRSYTEWGASGISETVLLVVGWGLAGAVGNATYTALRSTVVKLARAAQGDYRHDERPLERVEAEERGRWAVSGAFGLAFEDADRLAPIAAERSGDGWVMRYRLDDRRYEVELLEQEGLVTVARVGWSHQE